MEHCCIVKKTEYGHKMILNHHSLLIPEVYIDEYLFPKGLLWNLIEWFLIKKLSGRRIVFHEKHRDEKPVLERCLIQALQYILDFYGWKRSETEFAVVVNNFNDKVTSIMSELSHFARFLVVYGNEGRIYNNLLEYSGICVRYCNLNEPIEKIAVYIKDKIELKVLGNIYNDVSMTFDVENCSIGMREYEHICREFADKNDYRKLFERGYVKKMALKSK